MASPEQPPTQPAQISLEAQQQFKADYAETKLMLMDAQVQLRAKDAQIAALSDEVMRLKGAGAGKAPAPAGKGA